MVGDGVTQNNSTDWFGTYITKIFSAFIFSSCALSIVVHCAGESYGSRWKAVNILGLVAAADMQKSIATVHDGIPLIDVDFDELVIDEKKTKGIKMFRLAESTNAILVHESLRDALIEKGFGEDLAFYDLKEAAI